MKQANILDLIDIFSNKNGFFMSNLFFKKWKSLINNIEPIDTTFNLNNIFDDYFETAFFFEQHGELPIIFYSDNILKLINSNSIKASYLRIDVNSSDVHFDVPDDYSRQVNYGSEPLIVCLMPRFNKMTFTVIDGNHRASKASESGESLVHAVFISPDNLSVECFVNQQSYVNYKFLYECFILGLKIKSRRDRIHRFFSITLKRLFSKSI